MTRFNRENPYVTLPQLEKELEDAKKAQRKQAKDIAVLRSEIESSVAGVSGVKGDEEQSYRTGNVNITAGNVGAVPTSRTVNSKALSSDITLGASDVSAVALSDKYTRSSAGTLDWTDTTEGDAKVIAKSALAFWNGAYSGTSSNLSYFNTNAYFGGTQMKDFVTDQGTSSSWYYRKWKSGKIEAWTTYNAGSQTPSQWVTGWYYKDVNVAIPSGIFSATPTHVQATNIGSDYQYSVFTACPTSSTSIKVRVVKPNSGGATPVLSIYASNM